MNRLSGFRAREPRMPKVKISPRRGLVKITERGRRKAQNVRKKKVAMMSRESGLV